MRRARFRFLCLLCFLNLLHFLAACHKPPQSRITIGSKFFTEQVILAELLAQHIEARTGIPVVRKTNLGGTLLVHRALQAAELDLYVEYTGTALTAVLNESPSGDSVAVYNRVKQLYSQRFNLEVTEPLGFENTFAMVVRGDDAKISHLRTISDIAPLASWTSASSTAPSSIIKSTSLPAIPTTASSTPSASSPSKTTATISRPTTPFPSFAAPLSRNSRSSAPPFLISLANSPPRTCAALITPSTPSTRMPPPSSAPSANPGAFSAGRS